jgi:aspartate carbamoyltransferase catalytic subunit
MIPIHTLLLMLRGQVSKKKPHLSLNHLLTINSLTKQTILSLIERANELLATKTAYSSNHTDQPIITNLFFEPSTRTQYSFEIAAHRLHIPMITPNIPNLSTIKGESLLDTIHNLEAMGSSLFIIRHSINHTPEFIASELLTDAKVLNAGDGTYQHPSQCLIDLMTIQSHFTHFEPLSVAILGDTQRSRVARSLAAGLQVMGTTDIRFITPPQTQRFLIIPPL